MPGEERDRFQNARARARHDSHLPPSAAAAVTFVPRHGNMKVHPAGLEPAIFASGGRRLIHWATGARRTRFILGLRPCCRNEPNGAVNPVDCKEFGRIDRASYG